MALLSKKKKGKPKKTNKAPTDLSSTIPYLNVYKKGIIELREGVFSKSYRIGDINFKTADDQNQIQVATAYGQFLGGFEHNAQVEVTLYNKTIDVDKFKRKILMSMKDDDMNRYREEYNNMLIEKMSGAKNNLKTERILTISIEANDIKEASKKFVQIDRYVSETISTVIKADVESLDTIERLDLLNSIYNQDAYQPLYQERKIHGKKVQSFSLENCDRQGITTKEVIAPSGFRITNRFLEMGNSYVKSYTVANYPTWIKGTLLTDLASLPCNMLVSVYYDAMPQDEAAKFLRSKNVNITANIIERQKKAAGNYDMRLISPELSDAKDEVMELLNQMTKDNSRLFSTTMIITLFAGSEEELKRQEEQLFMEANKNLLTLRGLNFQQEQGLDSALPLGNNKIQSQRLMTTNTVSALLPFGVKEVSQENGLYYGLNAISNNMVLYDRNSDINPNGCILGMPGAGKSFSAKREIINVLLNTDDEVYIIDPEREYLPLATKFHGSVVKIANGSRIHINPFDMNTENAGDDGDPLKVKSDFISTVCEIAIGGKFGLSNVDHTIIGRCVISLYQDYLNELRKSGKTIDVSIAPTMRDFYDTLLMQPEPEAQTLALALERFVTGTYDAFSHRTNVKIDNRFIVYDVKDIGTGLKELGLQIALDNIWNKMIENMEKGKRTWIYIDEFHFLMTKKTSSEYISQIWKRARKWKGIPTAITQNVEDMLKSADARAIINNSSFVIMLGQSPINRKQLSDLLSITKEEQQYINVAKPGKGLLKIGENIIPIDDTFPKNTELYKIMTTKPDEVNERDANR